MFPFDEWQVWREYASQFNFEIRSRYFFKTKKELLLKETPMCEDMIDMVLEHVDAPTNQMWFYQEWVEYIAKYRNGKVRIYTYIDGKLEQRKPIFNYVGLD